jgi:hypothetical protein
MESGIEVKPREPYEATQEEEEKPEKEPKERWKTENSKTVE